MIEQILALVRESGQQSVIENPGVPNEHNDAVMQEASSSIFNGLQGLMQNGGTSALTTLFTSIQSGDSANPGVQQFSGQISGNLSQKFGLPPGVAQSLVGSLIPMVLGKMMNSGATGGGNGFNITDLLGTFTGAAGGGNAPGAGNILGNLSSMGTKVGLDRDGDGDTDLNDLLKLFGQ